MRNRFPEDTTIRRYLLGKLNSQTELEESLSEEMLFNDDLSEMVDAIEDEIIEDYLDGNLSAADRRSFEEYFLRPPQRREKVSFARELRHHFNPEDELNEPEPSPVFLPEPHPAIYKTYLADVVDHWKHHSRAYIQLTVLFAFSISALLYISNLHSKLSDTATNAVYLENLLKQERERSTVLAAQLQQNSVLPGTNFLNSPNLLHFAAHGSPGAGPQKVEIDPTIRIVTVRLPLEKPIASSYKVDLETSTGKKVWSNRLRPLISSSEPPQLTFDMPSEEIGDGEYSFVATPVLRSNSQNYQYHFLVHVAR